MRSDHRRPLVAYVLVSVACAAVVAPSLDLGSLGEKTRYGAFSDTLQTPSEMAGHIYEPPALIGLPDAELLARPVTASGDSIAPGVGAILGVVDSPVADVSAPAVADSVSSPSSGGAGTQPVVSALPSHLVGGGSPAGGNTPTGDGGDAPAGPGAGSDSAAGDGSGIFQGAPAADGAPVAAPTNGPANGPAAAPDHGNGHGNASGNSGQGNGHANGHDEPAAAPHSFAHVPPGAHPNGHVGPPPGQGPKDKGPKDNSGHGPQDNGAKDQGPKDKGPKDKGPKDKPGKSGKSGRH